jgi:hypothetical protein
VLEADGAVKHLLVGTAKKPLTPSGVAPIVVGSMDRAPTKPFALLFVIARDRLR